MDKKRVHNSCRGEGHGASVKGDTTLEECVQEIADHGTDVLAAEFEEVSGEPWARQLHHLREDVTTFAGCTQSSISVQN